MAKHVGKDLGGWVYGRAFLSSIGIWVVHSREEGMDAGSAPGYLG